MEPAVRQREHGLRKTQFRHGHAAAMEPAVERREHIGGPQDHLSPEGAAMEPAVERRERFRRSSSDIQDMYVPQWGRPSDGGSTLSISPEQICWPYWPQWSPPLNDGAPGCAGPACQARPCCNGARRQTAGAQATGSVGTSGADLPSNGGSTRDPGGQDGMDQPAAMEPAVQRREHQSTA